MIMRKNVYGIYDQRSDLEINTLVERILAHHAIKNPTVGRVAKAIRADVLRVLECVRKNPKFTLKTPPSQNVDGIRIGLR